MLVCIYYLRNTRNYEMKYIAFISYSHSEDNKFSSLLQYSLETFAKKWFQVRRVKIFRDVSNLSVSPHLWKDIENALNNSDFFIYLASPEASKSKWVSKEVDWWLKNKNKNKLLILLTDGNIYWDDRNKDFDRKTTSSLPNSLYNIYEYEPLFVDFTWVKKTNIDKIQNDLLYKNNLATISSKLLNESKDELIGYNAEQQKKRVVFLQITGIILFFLLANTSVFLYLFLEKKNIAEAQLVKINNQKEKITEKLVEAKHNLGIVFKNKADISYKNKEFNSAYFYSLSALSNLKKNSDEKYLILSQLIKIKTIPIIRNLGGLDSDTVWGVDFSPDGQKLVSGSSNNDINIWDIKTGKKILAIKNKTNGIKGVEAVSFNNNGNFIAAGFNDGSVKVFDTTTDPISIKFEFKEQTSMIRDISFNTEGNILAAATEGGSILIWDLENGKLLASLEDSYESELTNRTIEALNPGGKGVLYGNFVEIYSIDFNPYNSTLISGSKNGHVILWDYKNKKNTQLLKSYRSSVNTVRFSPSGNLLGVGFGNKIHIINTQTNEGVFLFENKSNINEIEFSPDENWLASGSRDGTKIWDLSSGNLVTSFSGNLYGTLSLSFSPSESIIATGSDSIRFWDFSKLEENNFLIGHDDRVVVAKFSPKQNIVATGSYDGYIILWDAYSKKIIQFIGESEGEIKTIDFSPNGKTIAYNAYVGEPVFIIKNGKYIPSNKPQGESFIRIADVETGKIIKSIRVHSSGIGSIKFSPNSSIIASSSGDGSIKFWDVISGKIIRIIHANKAGVSTINFSSDGRYIVSATETQRLLKGGSDTSINLWNVKTGEKVLSIENEFPISSVAISPNDKYIASASWGAVRLWDINTGVRISEFKHLGQVTKIVFSSDGKFLISSSLEKDLKIWDVSSEKALATIDYTVPIYDIDISFDSKLVALALRNNLGAIWHIPSFRHNEKNNYWEYQIEHAKKTFNLKMENFNVVAPSKK